MQQQGPVAIFIFLRTIIIGKSKSSAKFLNLPARIERLLKKDKECKKALNKLANYRKGKTLKKRKGDEEQEKKKKQKLEWKIKMSEITPILIATQITKPGKVASVSQVRKFLVLQNKKLARKDQKAITETNVVEKGEELY